MPYSPCTNMNYTVTFDPATGTDCSAYTVYTIPPGEVTNAWAPTTQTVTAVSGQSFYYNPVAWYDPNATGMGQIQYVYGNQMGNCISYGYPETEEQIALREEAEKKRVAAEAKAEELLLMCLNEKQREQYLKNGYLEVNTDKAKYRIKKGWSHNVEKLKDDGNPEASFCIHPGILVPTADNMLAQKLMLEHNEAEFLRLANRRTL